MITSLSAIIATKQYNSNCLGLRAQWQIIRLMRFCMDNYMRYYPLITNTAGLKDFYDITSLLRR
jgi:hypothetical protein